MLARLDPHLSLSPSLVAIDSLGQQLYALYTSSFTTSLAHELTSTLPAQTKLHAYRCLAAPFGPQPYIFSSPSRHARDLLCRLRLGVLPLGNELGRWAGLPRAQRPPCCLCRSPTCKLVEDEHHFLFDCVALAPSRLPYTDFLLSHPSVPQLARSDFVGPLTALLTSLWTLRQSLAVRIDP